MWPQYAQEYHPVELHELTLEELTGTRPTHRGTLMYLKQKGIPEDTIQFRDTGPQRGHLKKLVKAIEHDFYSGPVARHPEVQPPLGRGIRLRARDVGGPSQSRGYKPSSRSMASRELMTGRRDGRAAALFQRMKDRSDQYVVDESTAPGHYQQGSPYSEDHGQKLWQKSPWEAAAEDPLGLPDRAFEQPIPKPKPKPKLQNPAPVQRRGPPGYSQVDSIRQHQQAPRQPGSKPVKIGCTWKSEGNTLSKMRFHPGVRPYEMNYNRTARGWSQGNLQADDYEDGERYNPRPTSWSHEDGYSPQYGRQKSAEVARSRQVVQNVVGPRSWAGESDDL
ncbi:uncharacterized protein LOC110973694 [Acanthaster planci]|uniref:Uncharacterized protein LOC110973694 n=1 Tax=Acanthaster planci TaxID=133434 RepID=A0A8B7XKF4_ACAPL|nr:uncharacterized protein LOC110973694 [Acanthaster planci]